MSNIIAKSSEHKQSSTEDTPSLLSQMTLHFEYNKTIPEARAEVRAKQIGA